MASGMAQFNVVNTVQGVVSLATNQNGSWAAMGNAASNWWHQISSGNAYVVGQTTAVVASFFVGGESSDAAEVGEASDATSVLSKISDLKTIAADKFTSVADNLSGKLDLRTVLSTSGREVAFARAGDSESVLTSASRAAEDSKVVPNAVQANFNAVMHGADDATSVAIDAEHIPEAVKTNFEDNPTEIKPTTEETPKIDPIEVKFNIKSKYDPEEFKGQLQGQEEGMNKLTVKEYLDNRKAYQANGRATEAAAAQQAAREKVLGDKILDLKRSGMSNEQATTEAGKWMDTQAALHDPDMVAGGFGDRVTGMGDRGINSSIGGQWSSRIKAVDEAVQNAAANMTEEQKANTLLNMKLTGVIK